MWSSDFAHAHHNALYFHVYWRKYLCIVVCKCVCMCVYVCANVCVRMYVCANVCVCECANGYVSVCAFLSYSCACAAGVRDILLPCKPSRIHTRTCTHTHTDHFLIQETYHAHVHSHKHTIALDHSCYCTHLITILLAGAILCDQCSQCQI